MKCKHCRNWDYSHNKCYVQDKKYYIAKRKADLLDKEFACKTYSRQVGSDDELC